MSESQPVPVYEMRVECMNYCYGGSPVLDLDEYPDPADPRAIVKYADHLAALAERDRQHAEALAEAEQRWEDWSNELADLLPPEYDGDDAQEAYILRFVRDHVAALAEVEQRVRDEERSHFQEAVWTFDRGYRQGRAEALRQAREAVAGGFTTLANDPFISPEGRKEVDHYLTGAIEEIDALKGEQA